MERTRHPVLEARDKRLYAEMESVFRQNNIVLKQDNTRDRVSGSCACLIDDDFWLQLTGMGYTVKRDNVGQVTLVSVPKSRPSPMDPIWLLYGLLGGVGCVFVWQLYLFKQF